MTRLRTVVLLAVAVLLLAACGESRTVEEVSPETAATIGGLGTEPREIPRSEIEQVVSAVEGSDRFVQVVFQGSMPPTFRQNILTQLIQIEAIESLVEENGGEVTEADRQEIADALRQELSGALSESGGEADTEAILNEIDPYAQLLIERNSLLTALGRKLTEGEEPGSQDVSCVRHILVDEEARANELLAELQAGADFATLAEANSTDTGSGANGGDLECAPSSRYVPEFAQAVDGAPLNEVVGPVQTQFGYHLITVYDRRTEEVPVDASGPAGEAIGERLRSIQVSISPDLGSWNTDTLSVVEESQTTSTTQAGEDGGETGDSGDTVPATEGDGSTSDTSDTSEPAE